MPDLTLVDPYVEWRDNLNYRRRQQADFRREQRRRGRESRRADSGRVRADREAFRRFQLAQRLDFYQRQRSFRNLAEGEMTYYTDRTGQTLTPGQMLEALERANRAAGGGGLEGYYDRATGQYQGAGTVTVPGAFPFL
jgi:hypothetical protein